LLDLILFEAVSASRACRLLRSTRPWRQNLGDSNSQKPHSGFSAWLSTNWQPKEFSNLARLSDRKKLLLQVLEQLQGLASGLFEFLLIGSD
jgi:hypothetical protein